MSQIMARTEEMRAKAQSITARIREHHNSHDRMMSIVKNMGTIFSGKLPSKMLQNILSMKNTYACLYQNAESNAKKIIGAADAYDVTEDASTKDANVLGNSAWANYGERRGYNTRIQDNKSNNREGIVIPSGENNIDLSTTAHPVDGFSGVLDRDKYGFGIFRKGVNTDYATNGHSGYDFIGSEGTNIRTSTDGKVVVCQLDSGTTVENPNNGYGYYVMIEHEIDGEFYYVTYAHLKENPQLIVGSEITAGSIIGQIGKTGAANNKPHLHLDIRQAKNPSQQLSAAERVSSNKYDFVDPGIFFDKLGMNL